MWLSFKGWCPPLIYLTVVWSTGSHPPNSGRVRPGTRWYRPAVIQYSPTVCCQSIIWSTSSIHMCTPSALKKCSSLLSPQQWNEIFALVLTVDLLLLLLLLLFHFVNTSNSLLSSRPSAVTSPLETKWMNELALSIKWWQSHSLSEQLLSSLLFPKWCWSFFHRRSGTDAACPVLSEDGERSGLSFLISCMLLWTLVWVWNKVCFWGFSPKSQKVPKGF